MGRTDAEWHRAHRMPRNATMAQRVAWHREHAENCNCREMPAGIRKLVEAETGKAQAAGESRAASARPSSRHARMP